MTAIAHPGWHFGLHFDVFMIHEAFWSPSAFMIDKAGARLQISDTTGEYPGAFTLAAFWSPWNAHNLRAIPFVINGCWEGGGGVAFILELSG